MAEKRKHDSTPKSSQTRIPAENDPAPATSSTEPVTVENYPRKRIAIAVLYTHLNLLIELNLISVMSADSGKRAVMRRSPLVLNDPDLIFPY